MLLVAAMPTMLTSCDDDPWHRDFDYGNYDWYDDAYTDGTSDLVAMAQTLNGTWSGTATNEYTNNNGMRERTTFDVEFTFVQYSQKASNGTGYETDYDDDGNEQTLRFKWYIDPRTYNIYIEYLNSGYRYVLCESGNSDTSGFFVGYDDDLRKDVFSGVMEGVNNDEYIFFDCDRVTAKNAAPRLQSSAATVTCKSYGNAKGITRTDSNAPKKIRVR